LVPFRVSLFLKQTIYQNPVLAHTDIIEVHMKSYSKGDKQRHFDTRLLDDFASEDTSLVPPITYSATFKALDAAHFAEISSQVQHPRYYTRYGNPIHEKVAKLIADLEGAESGLVAASGMGAISSTLLALLQSKDHVVAQSNQYMGTAKMICNILSRFGVEYTMVDQTDIASFEKALRPDTKLILTETPSNPNLILTDLRKVAELGKKRGITTLCDNTFASPVNQNPIRLGMDLVIHSATKFLNGHHDVTAGAVVGRKDLIDEIWQSMIILGPTLSPMDAWLLLRGLRTLSVRVERQNQSALELANFLEQHPKVEKVFYPGLNSHPQHSLAREQMRGFGGVLSFTIRGNYQDAKNVVSRLEIPVHAVSLGGVESLVVHAASMWEGSMTEQQMIEAKIQPNLLRVSVGLENIEDLKKDFKQALNA